MASLISKPRWFLWMASLSALLAGRHSQRVEHRGEVPEAGLERRNRESKLELPLDVALPPAPAPSFYQELADGSGCKPTRWTLFLLCSSSISVLPGTPG